MSYRENPKDMPNDRIAAREKLRALAEEGEHTKEIEDAKQQKLRDEEERRKRQREAIEEAAKRDKNLREAICHAEDYLIGSTIACALLGVGLIVAISPRRDEIFPAVACGFVAVLFGRMFLALFAASVLWRSNLRREQQWLAGLPFSTSGYFEVLSQDPKSSEEISVRISFNGLQPDDDLLRGLLARRGATLHNNSHGTASAKSSKLECSKNFNGDETNRNYHLWRKTFLTEIALPLHEAFPVRAISFS